MVDKVHGKTGYLRILEIKATDIEVGNLFLQHTRITCFRFPNVT